METSATPPFIPPQFSGPSGMPPFGMPPPNWNAPWNPHQSHATPPWQTHPPNDTSKIDPQILAKAAEWTEHRAPDGRPYFYHAVRGESVWERPQALKDLDEAKMGAPPTGFMPPQMMPSLVQQNAINIAPPAHLPQVQGNVVFDPLSGMIKTDVQKSSVDLAEIEKEKKRKEMEEKRKKDEAAAAEKSKQAKPLDKSKPVSSTPISGTPW